ncbi:DEP domain-containing protein 1A [Amia ocellicauda]|uniref:DEP domain-containing protein 1A n=1 Tax=Amia ocellicauda TaxID=2972642 RepID=UPI00346445FB
MNFQESRIVTPGPYRATKLWNEVTKLFRAGMPLKKHRQHFRVFGNSFTAVAAADWLHELLRNNSNFGPEVTRQQTLQLLRKFLKNHVIEDVKGRWGSEDLEDNSQLFRFPPTSPLKAIPNRPSPLRKKTAAISTKDKEGFFAQLYRRSSKKIDCDSQENIDPLIQEEPTSALEREQVHSREITQEDIHDVWRNITLTHLHKTLGLTSLEDVIDPAQVNPEHIVYNMTNVNKHGVVTLEDKSGDLPHWVLSAMKCLANWPKYDSSQPSYPGFERDVFKTVSDYFLNLPQPLLTFEYYELFVNILVWCGYIVVQKPQCGKRKNQEEPCYPQPAKTLHLNDNNPFKSTECLLLSLLRKESLDESESPMKEVLCSNVAAKHMLKGCERRIQQYGVAGRRASDIVGGSCQNLSGFQSGGSVPMKFRPRCHSLEGIMDVSHTGSSASASPRSSESLSFSGTVFRSSQCRAGSLTDIRPRAEHHVSVSTTSLLPTSGSGAEVSSCQSSRVCTPSSQRVPPGESPQIIRSKSIGSCADIGEHKALSSSCFSIHAPVAEITMKPDFSSSIGLRRPSVLNLAATKNPGWKSGAVGRLYKSSLDVSEKLPTVPISTFARYLSPEQSLFQPQLERVAVEALQLCTLLLPPANRRRLQLLMRMISRMSQNVDMPRLHDAIGTRTLMVHTFSRCVLCCEEEVDLDELLATRLVSFLMDHHLEILQVPEYLMTAVQDHIDYLRKVQITYPGPGVSVTLPTYSFCRQITSQEFEEQKLSVSQAAIADLLENLIKDKSLSMKEKKKKLKQFQKQYPDIYHRRFPTTESEAQLFVDKPKIKPPMLLNLKRPKTLGMWN